MDSNIADTNMKCAWITIGSFDGVHIGHQQIIKTLVEGAKESNALCDCYLFPYPAKVLRPFPDPFYLTSPEEKIKCFPTRTWITFNH